MAWSHGLSSDQGLHPIFARGLGFSLSFFSGNIYSGQAAWTSPPTGRRSSQSLT